MEPQDTIEVFHGCVIQHGSYNDRIYLIKLASELSGTSPSALIQLAKERGYSKIFAKIPDCYAKMFFDAGFQLEARIPAFYSGAADALFLGFYLTEERAVEANPLQLEEFLKLALQKKTEQQSQQLEQGLVLRSCGPSDATALAQLYQQVFQSYPFPIHDPNYILETMQSHVDYFGIESHGQLIAASSAEMDLQASSVEMTDFATLPERRGHGFAQLLLAEMEGAMRLKGVVTAYTIARALSPGMNITFSKAGYYFGGRLKNNTNISGHIESMNVWHKALW
ncbi:MAG: putative beta-lysine N-acetyltransferase [Kiritimatiellae bacterium]|nr:putative beta-lysine N-acetyltransferase [Kiritimatiellia bacterium]